MNNLDGCNYEGCTSTNWEDECSACMCYKNGNASWCDGAKSTYYDTYHKEHGINPFGGSNWSNRKCNTEILPMLSSCEWGWECKSGLCVTFEYEGFINVFGIGHLMCM